MKRRSIFRVFKSSAATFLSFAVAASGQSARSADKVDEPTLSQNQDELVDSELDLDVDSLAEESGKHEPASEKSPVADKSKGPALESESPVEDFEDELAVDAVQDELKTSEAESDELDLDIQAENPAESTAESSGEGSTEQAPSQSASEVEPELDLEADGNSPEAISKAQQDERRQGRSSVQFDQPNSKIETRLNRLANGYNSVDDVQWEDLIGERREEIYPVQRGDTLWDISQTFFGDGYFWAKLWSQNGGLENPHRIVPGKAIRFVAGTEADAPAITVMQTLVAFNAESNFSAPMYREQADAEISQAEIDAGAEVENDELIPQPNLPPAKKSTPVAILPQSFQEPFKDLTPDFDASQMEIRTGAAYNTPAQVYVNSFIADQRPENVGVVDEIEVSEKFAAIGQNVFLKMKREIPNGTRVTILSEKGSPRNTSGVVLDVLAIAVMGARIDAQQPVYRATIVHSIGPVSRGSVAVTEPPPRTTFAMKGRRANVVAQIVGGEFDGDRKVLGPGAVIYLNAGSGAGLRVGDLLGVEARRGNHRIETSYPNLSLPIATIKIADVRNQVSTAVVLRSTEELRVGDLTSARAISVLPDLKTESADDAANSEKKTSSAEEVPPGSVVPESEDELGL